jgi:hypothetical protein
MTDEPTKDDRPDWRRSTSGLYVPQGVPDGGRKPTVGFARALETPNTPVPQEQQS